MDMNFFYLMRKCKGKDLEIELLKELRVQILLTELEGKQLQWTGHVKRMDKTMILRRELEL